MITMRRTTVGHVLAAGLAWGAQGCTLQFGGCEDDLTCLPEGPAPEPGDGCPADPADGEVPEHCGLWVSYSIGDDASPGTQAQPLKTLAEALKQAQLGKRRVYACGEQFAEAVDLPAGTSLFGGFKCEEGWRYRGEDRRATIAPAPGLIALRWRGGEGASLVGGVNVRSADATEPGGSSIAVLVELGATGTMRRGEITAGRGADGQNGEDGDHGGAQALKGLGGADGEAACSSDVGLGGAAAEIVCDGGLSSTGGQGGDGGELVGNGGMAGLQPPDPNPAGFGQGGKGESPLPACTPGSGGAQGAHGQDGAPAAGDGLISNDGYFGVPGGDGKLGLPGQGGGGGGASAGKASCGAAPHGGAGGGAGGTGGCGGKAGRGGQAGGSSIGVVAVSSVVEFYGVRIRAGDGGRGGDGGAGQLGGPGGLPGVGGQGFGAGADAVKSGCAGGAGGNGGNGGNGGGGHGGHSIGVASTGGASIVVGNSFLDVGKAGVGGKSGNHNAPPGEDGVATSARGTFGN
jgi:hypothetical protein